MKLRTATVTWISYNNFGTYLQAYALQQVLIKLDCDNHILDDKRIANPITLRSLLGKVKSLLLRTNHRANDSYYRKFKDHFLQIDNCSLGEANNNYDVFICGSDQIWSPYLKFEPYYYCGFTEKKKIAYAASTGTSQCNNDYIQNAVPYLNKFEAIAVRESGAAEMLQKFVSKEIQVVLDPTLLLTADEWMRIVPQAIGEKQPFIICYFLTPNRWYMDWVKEYSIKENKHLMIFSTHKEYAEYADCIIGGPQEFLSYIHHADMIFTDSFHASIFSILFHKRFVTFKRFKDGGGQDQNARIYNLFSQLNLSDHFIGEDDLEKIAALSSPDYAQTESILKRLRKDSLSFLQNALE